MRTIAQLKREALDGIDQLDASLARCAEPLPRQDDDLEAMIARPAATVAGSVNLLAAVRQQMKPTCDCEGNWTYVPAVSIDGPRALGSGSCPCPIDGDARVAVEGAQVEEAV